MSATALLATTYNEVGDEGQGVANSILGECPLFDQHLVTLWAGPIMERGVGSTALLVQERNLNFGRY